MIRDGDTAEQGADGALSAYQACELILTGVLGRLRQMMFLEGYFLTFADLGLPADTEVYFEGTCLWALGEGIIQCRNADSLIVQAPADRAYEWNLDPKAHVALGETLLKNTKVNPKGLSGADDVDITGLESPRLTSLGLAMISLCADGHRPIEVLTKARLGVGPLAHPSKINVGSPS